MKEDTEECRKLWNRKSSEQKYFRSHRVERCWSQIDDGFDFVVMITKEGDPLTRCLFVIHKSGDELTFSDKLSDEREYCLNLRKEQPDRIRV